MRKDYSACVPTIGKSANARYRVSRIEPVITKSDDRLDSLMARESVMIER